MHPVPILRDYPDPEQIQIRNANYTESLPPNQTKKGQKTPFPAFLMEFSHLKARTPLCRLFAF
jgi:hypothetical protein